MAEAAAGLLVAEQVVSTGVEAGVAASITKPTVPLKASFSQIGSVSDDETNSSLARRDHTLTIVGEKAYIFGGRTDGDQLATNDIHCIALPVKNAPTPKYQVVPAIPSTEGGSVPAPRTQHGACSLGKCVVIHGGCDENGTPIEEGSKLWLYDTENSNWQALEATSHLERTPPSRRKGTLLPHDGNLILYGGVDSNGSPLTDVWHFDSKIKVWNQLPQAPAAVTSAAIAGDTLYLVATTESLSSEVHHLDIKLYQQEPPTWKTISVPINPFTPGPRPRQGGALLPVTTGFGRRYLAYFFGERLGSEEAGDLRQWSDIWTFQLPSSDVEVKATTSLADAFKPAKIKDQIRSKLGAETGTSSWAEVEVQAPGDLRAHDGKIHPGPRSSFGFDVVSGGSNIILWGGKSADGKVKGDGWMIQLS
ncbi:hypothetical protein F5Y17DRAFT_437804 [Xylariaceae sp. FL0594]|nr:hypothetical protein F5Y17DRAFT_437804 [Xylariaceae sp. FL0594]